jgi:hypothetical protein
MGVALYSPIINSPPGHCRTAAWSARIYSDPCREPTARKGKATKFFANFFYH